MIRFNLLFALSAAVFIWGCSTSATENTGNARVTPAYDEGGRLKQLTFDRDSDGKVDTWGYMEGSRVSRVEVDENGDGNVDRWEHYNPDAQGARGAVQGGPASTAEAAPVDLALERIERATRRDGKISRRDFFENGRLVRVEEDTDGNGRLDKWETYTDGTLQIMALDSTGRGTPDRRLVYQPDGTLNRIEVDPTGSGTFRPLTK